MLSIQRILPFFRRTFELGVLLAAAYAGTGCGDASSMPEQVADGDGGVPSSDALGPDSDSASLEAATNDGETADGAAHPADCSQLDTKFATIRDTFQASLTKHGVHGGAIALLCGGQVRTAGLGTVQQGGAPVGPTTRFQMASITKMFTAAAAVSLAKQGAIDLKSPVSGIESQLGYGEITLDQILSHSSGLPTMFPNEDVFGLQNWLTESSNVKTALWAPPGAVWYYNNDGYAVAGALLEIASGKPFPSVVQEHVFARYGMSHATMLVSEVSAGGDFAYGYSGSNTSTTALGPNDSYYADPIYGPMGGAWASADDMAAFAGALLGHHPESSLLSPLLERRIRTGIQPGQSYGYGLSMDDGLSPPLVSHGGSVQGFLSDMQLVPTADVGVVAMVNSDWYYPEDVTAAAVKAFVQVEVVRPASPVPSERWPLLIGTYDSLVFGKVVVSVEGGGLQAQFVDKGTTSALVQDSFYLYDNYTFDWTDPFEGPVQAPLTFWVEGASPALYVVSPFGVGTRQ